MITIQGLSKSYAGRSVLKSVDLSVQPGEFLVVLGPSGAGKSTLLRCINGLVQPDGGHVLIDGSEYRAGRAGRSEQRRPVAMIFQHHNLVRRLTVLKNVLVGRMAGLSSLLAMLQFFPSRDVAVALACLDRVELSHKAMSRADQLSGGEQQRVGIARALAQEPAAILADEPVASLDPKTSRVVLGYLKRICKETNIAVICNLHQIEYAVEFGERIVGLQGGMVMFDGVPSELTSDVVHRIYPGLEDPGIERILAPSAAPAPLTIARAATAVA
jgi:phosphonate transport system ATP-binding protein